MNRIGKSHTHSRAAGQGAGAMPLLYGVIALLCAFCVFWAAASLLVSLWKDPLLLLPHAAHLVMLLTVFFGSLLFARKVGKSGALCGLLGAGVLGGILGARKKQKKDPKKVLKKHRH